MALADTAKLIVALTLDDKFSGPLRNAQGQLKGMQGGLRQMGRGVGQISGGLNTLATRGAVAAVGGLTAVVATAASFESAFAGVEKTVDATDDELADLEDQFRQLAREMPVSFEELAAIGETGGALGIAKEDLIGFTEVVAQLAATTDLTSDAAATSLGQLQHVLGLTADDFDNFGAALVDLGNKGASTESQIVEIAARAGAAGDLIGLGADEVLGFGAAVANLGIEAEAGGTSLQKFFLESLQNIQDDDTLQVMADTAGTTADAFKQAFEEDATGALVTFIEGLGDLDEASQLAVLSALGFSDARITRTLLGLAGDTENLTDALNTSAEGWEDNTALSEEFAKRQETTAALWQVMVNNARDALATIGEELLPVANEAMQEFVGWLQQPGTQAGIGDLARDIAGGVKSLIGELKGTDFSGIIGGMKLAAEVAKGAFDVFKSLPAPIQQLAIAALVANKVTGGAIGQIAAGLGNLVLGSLKTITASHVTVVGGSVTGGGGGVPAAGGRGGALATAAKFVLGPAAAIAIGAEIAAAINAPTIKPARDFEAGAVEATLKTGDAVKLQTAINTIDDQLMSSDFGTASAMFLSRIPIIQDALGNVAPTLEAQREALVKELEEVQRLQTQAKSSADAKAAQQLRAAGVHSGYLSRINQTAATAHATATRQRQEIKQAQVNAMTQANSKANALLAQSGQHSGYLSRTASATEVVSRKNFDPKVTVNVSSTVSTSVILDRFNRTRITTSSGYTSNDLSAGI
jgi:TP901 family phage tail tape measure protein